MSSDQTDIQAFVNSLWAALAPHEGPVGIRHFAVQAITAWQARRLPDADEITRVFAVRIIEERNAQIAELQARIAAVSEPIWPPKTWLKNHEGLERLADCDAFWEQQPYGTRLYFGPGITEYLHRSVLQEAVKALTAHPRIAAVSEPLAIVDVTMGNGLRWLRRHEPLPENGTKLYAHPPTSEWNEAIEAVEKLLSDNWYRTQLDLEHAIRGLKK